MTWSFVSKASNNIFMSFTKSWLRGGVRTVIQHLVPWFITLVNFVCFLALNYYGLDLVNLSRRWTGYFQSFHTCTNAIVGQTSTYSPSLNSLEWYILDLGDLGLTRGRYWCILSILALLGAFIVTLSLPHTSIFSPMHALESLFPENTSTTFTWGFKSVWSDLELDWST